MPHLVGGGVSDVGRVRSINQDAALLAPPHLFAVADGMGGAAAGEVASRLALETFEVSVSDGTLQGLVNGVRWANRSVFQKAIDEPEMRGMGTTLCALGLVEVDGYQRIGIVNVGDSRVYVLQDGVLTQVTLDHSVVEELVREGALTPDEARYHPQRNMLTRSIGIDIDVAVDSWEVTPHVGDRYLLCSDGLFNEVTREEIEAVLLEHADPTEAARVLVDQANERGGRDNITAVVVDVIEDEVVAAIEEEPSPSARDTLVPDADTDDGALPIAESTPALDDAPTLMDTKVVTSPADAPTVVDVPAPRPRRFTWRVVVFLTAIAAVIAGAIVAIVAWPEDDTPVRPSATTTTASTVTTVPRVTTTLLTGTTRPRTTVAPSTSGPPPATSVSATSRP